ncbi:hypothetical protein V2J82_25545 [Pseudomonas alliivorans]|nr:hypothetical protein [Pseudomonas alliivorans]
MDSENDWLIGSTKDPEHLEELLEELKGRCKAADIDFKEHSVEGDISYIVIGFKCARERREIVYWNYVDLAELSKHPFENYSYLTGLDAICSYEAGEIEVALRSVGVSVHDLYLRLFGISPRDVNAQSASVFVPPLELGGPSIEIGIRSAIFSSMNDAITPKTLSLKITGLKFATHDAALECLKKVGDSVLFQTELVCDVGLTFRRRRSVVRRVRKKTSWAKPDLRFPTREFDSAPLSLYWYGRSAAVMPLLQYLAYYQVIEFYFPIYSQSEAHRKLKTILRNPAFRAERDTDIAKLLGAIHISRNGAFGDERSQLKSTVEECIDVDELREFLTNDSDMYEFFSVKSKLGCQKLSLANLDMDLRPEIARRIYDIRCKIVHTKTDARDATVELLLPFSKEADQLPIEIELIRFVAQRVLIAGSREL